MGRSLCSCCEEGLKKGPWTPEEDQKLIAYIEEHGHGSWSALRAKAGLQRCGKSCRLRWTNYLRPDIKRGKFSLDEDQIIIQLHALLGNRWSTIATYLPKRTDNEIKNHWNTHIKKRLAKMGIDPVTHKPKTDALGSGCRTQKEVAHLSHMIQWEKTRLEAEARLVRHSNPNFQNQLRSTALAQPPFLDILRAANDSELPIPTMGSNSMAEMEFSGSSINTTCEGLWIPGPLSNFMQGYFNDLLLHNNGYSSDGADQNFNNAMGGSGGEFEDNINYWNSILLNLMNSSSP